MWRNVSWNSTDSSLPDGMHRHETGAYFKTPSIQSATSSQSGGGGAITIVAGGPAVPDALASSQNNELVAVGENSNNGEMRAGAGGWTTQQQPAAASNRRERLKETKGSGGSKRLSPTGGAGGCGSGSGPASSHPHGFRSRLSSISGALQHPKLTSKRLFSHHGSENTNQQARAPIQITTTSIDTPQHQPSANKSGSGASMESAAAAAAEAFEHERLLSSASGRRLSQLFLPQSATNPMLSHHQQDPYANNELIPPHLLGLYGQPPLVAGSVSPGGSGSGGPLGHRASWADASLFGRLSNVRPSIDSSFQGAHIRHSFDARKY